MKAYKVFNNDWTCRGYQFEVGKTYEIEGELEMCANGFHACKNVCECFNYYSFNPDNKVAEVELLGDVLGSDDNKQCCSRIKIVREIEWSELLTIANTGHSNTGHSNTGDRNTGDRNTGDSNTGDWNTADWNTGYFNSRNPKDIQVFNKACKMSDWEQSAKPSFIYNIYTTEWIHSSRMTLEEKENHPEHSTLDGYLKRCSYKEAWQNSFKDATSEDIDLLKRLPNFNSDIFEEITGIKVK